MSVQQLEVNTALFLSASCAVLYDKFICSAYNALLPLCIYSYIYFYIPLFIFVINCLLLLLLLLLLLIRDWELPKK